jgi:hypothetical protein
MKKSSRAGGYKRHDIVSGYITTRGAICPSINKAFMDGAISGQRSAVSQLIDF